MHQLQECILLIYARVEHMMRWRRRREAPEQMLLVAMLSGAVLKAHRALDGSKRHKLHQKNQPPQRVAERVVRRLEMKQLIQSNLKFPAATYLLTEQGADLARQLSGDQMEPLTVRITSERAQP